MKYKIKFKLLTCLITLLVFILLSICAGLAIWYICQFVVMLGPVVCATIVMLTLLGWAVYHEVGDGDRRE